MSKGLTLEEVEETVRFLQSKRPSNFPFEIPITISDMFPFEQHYEACDVLTKHEIRVPSGEIVHGVFIDDKGYVSAVLYDKLNQQT